ncbi:MAG TPA: YceI family protein [Puia sp.]|nr:YceI family protein [Puia sp.]
MRRIIAIIGMIICCCQANSQMLTTRTGFIGFYSKTPLEDIKAENNQVYAAIDASKKNIAFTLLLKSFIFTKELMQEHFNENYVESDKYPKANFTGSFTGDFVPDKDGAYNVLVKGNLTMHNVTKAIEVPAMLEVKSGKVSGKSEFKLNPEDFNINIPYIVREKITKEIIVRVNIECNSTK